MQQPQQFHSPLGNNFPQSAGMSGTTPLLPPQHHPLGDRFTIIRELGRGASGVVTLCRRNEDRQLVAVKEIYCGQDAEERRRIFAEGKLMLNIPQHPSIVRIEGVIETRDSVFLILEYVPEGSMYNLIYPPSLLKERELKEEKRREAKRQQKREARSERRKRRLNNVNDDTNSNNHHHHDEGHSHSLKEGSEDGGESISAVQPMDKQFSLVDFLGGGDGRKSSLASNSNHNTNDDIGGTGGGGGSLVPNTSMGQIPGAVTSSSGRTTPSTVAAIGGGTSRSNSRPKPTGSGAPPPIPPPPRNMANKKGFVSPMLDLNCFSPGTPASVAGGGGTSSAAAFGAAARNNLVTPAGQQRQPSTVGNGFKTPAPSSSSGIVDGSTTSSSIFGVGSGSGGARRRRSSKPQAVKPRHDGGDFGDAEDDFYDDDDFGDNGYEDGYGTNDDDFGDFGDDDPMYSQLGDASSPSSASPASASRNNPSSDIYLEEERLVKWFTQLANAVAFLHSHNVVHRDIKLDNILVTSGHTVVKICDFGVATTVGRAATAGMSSVSAGVLSNAYGSIRPPPSVGVFGTPGTAGGTTMAQSMAQLEPITVGTPQYMPPEICDGRPHSLQCDVWSLGVSFYEMACRRLPFDAQNMLALMHKVIEHPARALPMPPFSRRLNAIILSMLAKDPRRRPTMRQVVQMFAHYRKARAAFEELKEEAALRMPRKLNGDLYDADLLKLDQMVDDGDDLGVPNFQPAAQPPSVKSLQEFYSNRPSSAEVWAQTPVRRRKDRNNLNNNHDVMSAGGFSFAGSAADYGLVAASAAVGGSFAAAPASSGGFRSQNPTPSQAPDLASPSAGVLSGGGGGPSAAGFSINNNRLAGDYIVLEASIINGPNSAAASTTSSPQTRNGGGGGGGKQNGGGRAGSVSAELGCAPSNHESGGGGAHLDVNSRNEEYATPFTDISASSLSPSPLDPVSVPAVGAVPSTAADVTTTVTNHGAKVVEMRFNAPPPLGPLAAAGGGNNAVPAAAANPPVMTVQILDDGQHVAHQQQQQTQLGYRRRSTNFTVRGPDGNSPLAGAPGHHHTGFSRKGEEQEFAVGRVGGGEHGHVGHHGGKYAKRNTLAPSKAEGGTSSDDDDQHDHHGRKKRNIEGFDGNNFGEGYDPNDSQKQQERFNKLLMREEVGSTSSSSSASSDDAEGSPPLPRHYNNNAGASSSPVREEDWGAADSQIQDVWQSSSDDDEGQQKGGNVIAVVGNADGSNDNPMSADSSFFDQKLNSHTGKPMDRRTATNGGSSTRLSRKGSSRRGSTGGSLRKATTAKNSEANAVELLSVSSSSPASTVVDTPTVALTTGRGGNKSNAASSTSISVSSVKGSRTSSTLHTLARERPQPASDPTPSTTTIGTLFGGNDHRTTSNASPHLGASHAYTTSPQTDFSLTPHSPQPAYEEKAAVAVAAANSSVASQPQRDTSNVDWLAGDDSLCASPMSRQSETESQRSGHNALQQEHVHTVNTKSAKTVTAPIHNRKTPELWALSPAADPPQRDNADPVISDELFTHHHLAPIGAPPLPSLTHLVADVDEVDEVDLPPPTSVAVMSDKPSANSGPSSQQRSSSQLSAGAAGGPALTQQQHNLNNRRVRKIFAGTNPSDMYVRELLKDSSDGPTVLSPGLSDFLGGVGTMPSPSTLPSLTPKNANSRGSRSSSPINGGGGGVRRTPSSTVKATPRATSPGGNGNSNNKVAGSAQKQQKVGANTMPYASAVNPLARGVGVSTLMAPSAKYGRRGGVPTPGTTPTPGSASASPSSLSLVGPAQQQQQQQQQPHITGSNNGTLPRAGRRASPSINAAKSPSLAPMSHSPIASPPDHSLIGPIRRGATLTNTSANRIAGAGVFRGSGGDGNDRSSPLPPPPSTAPDSATRPTRRRSKNADDSGDDCDYVLPPRNPLAMGLGIGQKHVGGVKNRSRVSPQLAAAPMGESAELGTQQTNVGVGAATAGRRAGSTNRHQDANLHRNLLITPPTNVISSSAAAITAASSSSETPLFLKEQPNILLYETPLVPNDGRARGGRGGRGRGPINEDDLEGNREGDDLLKDATETTRVYVFNNAHIVDTSGRLSVASNSRAGSKHTSPMKKDQTVKGGGDGGSGSGGVRHDHSNIDFLHDSDEHTTDGEEGEEGSRIQIMETSSSSSSSSSSASRRSSRCDSPPQQPNTARNAPQRRSASSNNYAADANPLVVRGTRVGANTTATAISAAPTPPLGPSSPVDHSSRPSMGIRRVSNLSAKPPLAGGGGGTVLLGTTPPSPMLGNTAAGRTGNATVFSSEMADFLGPLPPSTMSGIGNTASPRSSSVLSNQSNPATSGGVAFGRRKRESSFSQGNNTAGGTNSRVGSASRRHQHAIQDSDAVTQHTIFVDDPFGGGNGGTMDRNGQSGGGAAINGGIQPIAGVGRGPILGGSGGIHGPISPSDHSFSPLSSFEPIAASVPASGSSNGNGNNGMREPSPPMGGRVGVPRPPPQATGAGGGANSRRASNSNSFVGSNSGGGGVNLNNHRSGAGQPQRGRAGSTAAASKASSAVGSPIIAPTPPPSMPHPIPPPPSSQQLNGFLSHQNVSGLGGVPVDPLHEARTPSQHRDDGHAHHPHPRYRRLSLSNSGQMQQFLGGGGGRNNSHSHSGSTSTTLNHSESVSGIGIGGGGGGGGGPPSSFSSVHPHHVYDAVSPLTPAAIGGAGGGRKAQQQQRRYGRGRTGSVLSVGSDSGGGGWASGATPPLPPNVAVPLMTDARLRLLSDDSDGHSSVASSLARADTRGGDGGRRRRTNKKTKRKGSGSGHSSSSSKNSRATPSRSTSSASSTSHAAVGISTARRLSCGGGPIPIPIPCGGDSPPPPPIAGGTKRPLLNTSMSLQQQPRGIGMGLSALVHSHIGGAPSPAAAAGSTVVGGLGLTDVTVDDVIIDAEDGDASACNTNMSAHRNQNNDGRLQSTPNRGDGLGRFSGVTYTPNPQYNSTSPAKLSEAAAAARRGSDSSSCVVSGGGSKTPSRHPSSNAMGGGGGRGVVSPSPYPDPASHPHSSNSKARRVQSAAASNSLTASPMPNTANRPTVDATTPANVARSPSISRPSDGRSGKPPMGPSSVTPSAERGGVSGPSSASPASSPAKGGKEEKDCAIM